MPKAVPPLSDHPSAHKGFKVVSTLLLWVVYALSFLLLVPYVEEPTGILILLPVLVSSWLWGMRAGATLALAGGLLNFGLYLPTGLLENRPWIILPPNLVIFLVGILVGYLQDLRQTLRRQNALISFQADHDPLTGLRNRASFSRKARQVLEAPDLGDGLLSLLYIDLDGFKQVNDTYGHATGDALLVAVAERLRKVTRASDLHARLGGDEFVVLLPGLTCAADAELVADKVLGALTRFYPIEGGQVNIQASIGISLFCDGQTLEDLLHLADQAMYKVKKQGKNGICFALEQGDETFKVAKALGGGLATLTA